MKNKFFIIPFFAVILISLIFLAAQIPTAKINPKDLPMAIVNEDQGEMSATLAEKLLENAPEAIKFIEYDSVEEMEEGMNERETYAGLVIPESFTAQIASFQSESPEQAIIQIYLNEGYNTTVATTAETMLQKIIAQLSSTVSDQMTAQLTLVGEQMKAQAGDNAQLAQMISPVKPEMVKLLANPITFETEKINPAGDLASVPMGLFTAVWMSSLLGAMLFYMAGNFKKEPTLREQRKNQAIQFIMPIIYSLFAGYVITLIATWILGYEFASFNAVALTLTIALLGFSYLVLALLKLVGIPIVPVFAILMFFGLPLLQMAPEMIPTFYRDFVLPWLPMRFLIDALKEVVFFGNPVINSYTIVLISIAVVSAIILLIRNFFLNKKLHA
jgi:YhgE/Pip-like protein